MSRKTPLLLILSAPSGAGKTTLCDLLLKDFSNLRLSISTTTRARRPYEKDGVHYFFVDPKAFQEKIDHGDFAEWATVHGHLYGTSKKTIETCLTQGHSILFDIDVQGAMSLKAAYPERALLIFIHPPSMDILKQRLIDRKGDSLTSIENRLKNAYDEVEWSHKFDYQITNDNLTQAYQKLKEIVKKEGL